MEFDHSQEQAMNRMKSGSILVGGTGSGKSRTSLAYFFVKELGNRIDVKDGYGKLYFESKKCEDLYIITTAAKRDKHEWEKEMIPFCLSATVDSWNNISKYTEVTHSFFIFDEQRVVGSGTWAKSFIKISKNNNWIMLSATPGDQWSDYIPVFIANGFYKNRTQFYNRHVVWSRYAKYPKIDKYIEEDHLEKLKNYVLIEMDVNRETRPHRIMVDVDYDKNNYKTVTKDRWNVFDGVPIENAPQYMSVLRRVVNSDPSRCNKIKELIKLHHKIIIFYSFDYERDLIIDMARKEHIELKEWNGHNHESLPNTNEWIYLVQYMAGSEGWECTETDTMVFYSLSYSYRMTHQAAGRIDRRNTKFKNLYYYYLISKSALDGSIVEALENKRDFNERKFKGFKDFENLTTPIIEKKDK